MVGDTASSEGDQQSSDRQSPPVKDRVIFSVAPTPHRSYIVELSSDRVVIPDEADEEQGADESHVRTPFQIHDEDDFLDREPAGRWSLLAGTRESVGVCILVDLCDAVLQLLLFLVCAVLLSWGFLLFSVLSVVRAGFVLLAVHSVRTGHAVAFLAYTTARFVYTALLVLTLLPCVALFSLWIFEKWSATERSAGYLAATAAVLVTMALALAYATCHYQSLQVLRKYHDKLRRTSSRVLLPRRHPFESSSGDRSGHST